MAKQNKQQYPHTIQNGGKANTVLGWLWLCAALYWAVEYLLVSLDINNLFITVWTLWAALDGSINIILVCLGIVLGIFYLCIGRYVTRQYGPRSKLLLLIGAIIGFVFALSLFPIIPAIFSLLGYLAYRKSGIKPTAKKHRYTTADLRQKSVYAAGIFILIIVAVTVVAYVKDHAPLPKSSEAASQTGTKDQEIKGFDFTDGKPVLFGYCTNVPKATESCDYTSETDGYSITFPGGKAHGNPYMIYSPITTSPIGQTGRRTLSNFNGYNLIIHYYKQAASEASVANDRLKNVLDDKIITSLCRNADYTDGKIVPVYGTYKGLPSASLSYTGDGMESTCTLYARAMVSGTKVYIVYVISNDAEPISEADYTRFLESMHIN